MKSFRSFGFALAMACLGLASYVAEPLLRICEPMFRYVSHGIDAMACGVAKLTRELVHSFTGAEQRATGFGSGLDREGNGFRQSSAADIGAQPRVSLAI
jgi:hypothetical protein